MMKMNQFSASCALGCWIPKKGGSLKKNCFLQAIKVNEKKRRITAATIDVADKNQENPFSQN